MKPTTRAVATSLLTLVMAGAASAQSSRVTWYSFDMGYHALKAGNTEILSVIGQDFVGAARQSDTQVISGFLTDTLTGGTIVSVRGQEGLPESYALSQNYPNPFNPSTTVHFDIPVAAHVTLRVYNVLGQEIMTVLDEEKVAGRYDVRIDASALSSGAYFYRLQAEPPATSSGLRERAGAFVQTRKFLLLR